MTKNSQKTAGFTVIELLVAMSVMGLLIIVFLNFTNNTLVQTSITSARGDLLREAQLALDLIARDIRLSSNADDLNRIPDNNAPDAPTNPFSWYSNETTLILATAAIDANKNIIFEDPLRYSSLKNNSIYYIKDRTLYKRTLAADNPENTALTSCPENNATTDCPADRKLIINTVEQFKIRYLSADDTEVLTPTEARSVELTLALQTKRFGRTIQTSYVTRTVFRNE